MLNLINFMTYTTQGIIVDYVIVIIVAIALALILRLPLLPSKPIRYSFDVSALYPTPLIAIGVYSIFFVFKISGILIAILIGIFTALFVKYLFFKVFPKPKEVE